MKTYFILSDIHSFFIEMKEALYKAGFRKTNKEHILVILGDVFDRGPDALKVYKYIKSIPKSRRILIKGNHEDLYLELLTKPFPDNHDFHNCTVDTFCQIAQMPIDLLNEDTYDYDYQRYLRGSRNSWREIRDKVALHPITKWIESKEWKNYFELNKYIFVHSFIPTKIKKEALEKYGSMAYAFERPEYFEYDPEWRKVQYWGSAIWGCPWAQYKQGLFASEEEKGKVLVCGHWHTSDFFEKLKNIKVYARMCAPIYYSKGLIGIDGGVTYNAYYEIFNHPQNILVIKEEDFTKCYDIEGKLLVEPEEEKRG